MPCEHIRIRIRAYINDVPNLSPPADHSYFHAANKIINLYLSRFVLSYFVTVIRTLNKACLLPLAR